MKNLIVSISALIFILAFLSCNSGKKTSENQNVSSTQVINDTTAAVPEQAKETKQNKYNEGASMLGSKVVEGATKRLVTKLNLSNQEGEINKILTKSFIQIGEDLNKEYTLEQSRILGHEIMKKSTNEIAVFLDPAQKEQFSNFVNREGDRK